MPPLGAILTLLLVLVIVGAFVAIMAAFATGRWSMCPKENRSKSESNPESKAAKQEIREEDPEQ